ncbi:lethal(2)neighbour of tid protein 2 [Culicoides brevitarsis]|uniref:lethal(2)neighbour of tid protein 2 n=1 Tax=Culicoides brevitarsis TaxID=469753 RepID=UPI00307B8F89
MAPATKSNNSKFAKFSKKYLTLNFIKSLIFDPAQLWIVSLLILVAELVLNVLIVHRVKYTEIDWTAYMQQIDTFLNGTLDYSKLHGDTGPLVYPAGHVYIYTAFYYLTSFGKNIRLGQYLFIGIYLMQMTLVLRLYTKCRKVPPYVLVITAFTSYRVHSIYVLRLFNDPLAVLFLYMALNLFMDQKWSLGSIAFSVAVSIKMNILLFAPALLLFYITNVGYKGTFKQLSICAAVQLLLGAPFLATYPVEYIKGAFNLGRVFEHKWTVNYRFLPEEIFVDKKFHLALLGVHLALLALFATPSYKYFMNYFRLRQLEKQLQPQIDAENRLKKTQKVKKSTKNEEKLTKDQQEFLNSFEKGLKKNMKQQGKQPEKVEEPIEEDSNQKYSVHFEQSTQLALLPLFLSNFIGMICCRSLHYQFYIWYFHSLPYLLWSTNFSTNVRFLLLFLIELSWNTYPSTDFSSELLHVCHILVLIGIGRNMMKTLRQGQEVVDQSKKQK